MSIVRFGEDGSDVYLYYVSNDLIQCCGCELKPESPENFDARGALNHVAKHRAAGHYVPDCVDAVLLEALEREE